MLLQAALTKMDFDWTKSEFDWKDILDVDPSPLRVFKIAYQLMKALVKMAISERSTEIILAQSRPNGDKFYTRIVLRGFVFCTFLPGFMSRYLPRRHLTIQYSNGKCVDIYVTGLVANPHLEEFDEAEFVSEGAAMEYYKCLRSN